MAFDGRNRGKGRRRREEEERREKGRGKGGKDHFERRDDRRRDRDVPATPPSGAREAGYSQYYRPQQVPQVPQQPLSTQQAYESRRQAFLGGEEGYNQVPGVSHEEVIQMIKQACKGGDISKATEAICNLEEDARDLILTAVLEDIYLAIEEVKKEREAVISCEDCCELAYQIASLPLPQLSQQQHVLIQEIANFIADYAKYRTEELGPGAISRMIWGFATLGVRHETMMSIVAAEVVKKIQGFNHQELAKTSWAFAKCGLWNDQLARSLATQCFEQMQDFSTDSLSKVAWAMAQWQTRDEALLMKMGDCLLTKLETFEPQAMSTIAWAFSSLSYRHANLTTAIAQESANKIGHFSMKETSHVAWAFANLRVADSLLFSKVEEHILRTEPTMQPSEIANLAWAFAKTGLASEQVMKRLAKQAVPQIGGFKATEITMLTWAYAASQQQDVSLMFEVGTKVSQRCNKFSPHQLAHIVWAYGALGMRHSELCEAVSKSCQLEMSGFNANALAQICWGFAMVEHRHVSFMHEAARYIVGGIETLKPLALWRCASAFNSLMVHSKEMKESILQEALQKHEEFSLKGLSRLLDCYVMSHASVAQESLMKVLEHRLEEVAQQLLKLHRGAGPEPKAMDFLTKCGFLELQAQGMKQIFQRLGISTPSWAFLSKAMKEAATYSRCLAFVVVELSSDGAAPLLVTRAYEEKEVLDSGPCFRADTFPPATPDGQVVHFVLEVVAQKLFQDQVKEGLLQLLLLQTPAPSGNVVSLLLQFQSSFPKVHLRFTEVFAESKYMRRAGQRR